MLTPEELNSALHKRFAYEEKSEQYEDFKLYDSATVGAGATAIILEYETKPQPGALKDFTLQFLNFTPNPKSYIFKLTLNGQLIPKSLGLGIFEYSNYINEKVDYFINFDSQPNIIKAEIINNGGGNIYPRIKINGFYLDIPT